MNLMTYARDWINVPFKNKGRSRNGVDCIGLLMCLSQEIGIKSKLGGYIHNHDCIDYTLKDHLSLNEHFDLSYELKYSNLAIFDFGYGAQHLGIIASYNNEFSVIHAHYKAGKVTEHRLDDQLLKQITNLYYIKINPRQKAMGLFEIKD